MLIAFQPPRSLAFLIAYIVALTALVGFLVIGFSLSSQRTPAIGINPLEVGHSRSFGVAVGRDEDLARSGSFPSSRKLMDYTVLHDSLRGRRLNLAALPRRTRALRRIRWLMSVWLALIMLLVILQAFSRRDEPASPARPGPVGASVLRDHRGPGGAESPHGLSSVLAGSILR